MSQYGAMGYAEHGWTYDRILAHYYTDTALSRLNAPRDVRVLLASPSGTASFSGATAAAGRTLSARKTYRARARAGGQRRAARAERAPRWPRSPRRCA